MKRFTVLTALTLLAAVAAPPVNAAPPTTSSKATKPKASKKAPAASHHLAIVGAKVHVGDGTVIENGVVEIRDGEIVAVGGSELSAKLGDAQIVDAKGKIVTPGFIASDVALGLVEIGMEGSTRDDAREDDEHVRAGYDPSPGINADSSLIQVQAVEGITSAAVAPSGGLLSGQVTWIDLLEHDHANIVASANIAVDGNLGQSVQGSRAAAVSTLRQALEDARFYRRSKAAFDRGSSRKLVAHPSDLRALFPVLDRKVPLTMRADRVSDMLALLAIAEDFKIDLVIVGGAEAWKVREQLADAKVPVIIQPTSNLPGSYDRMGARLENAKLLHEAGVEVSITDFGDPHNVRNLKQEAGVAAAYGLPWEAALAAISSNPAKAYGVDDRYGTLAKGKVANVVMWSHDPLELSSWPEQVWIRGNAIAMRSRQTQLRDRYMDLSRFKP